MAKKKKYENYLEFLETRINSANFKKNATLEEWAEAKAKYDREKFLQRMLKKK